MGRIRNSKSQLPDSAHGSSSRSSSSSSAAASPSSSSASCTCCAALHLRRGPWTVEEDELLLRHMKVHGDRGNWRKVPRAAGLMRCGKSCRLRWLNYLRPDLKRGGFSEAEDDLIIKLHGLLGNRWSLIAGRIPGRSDNEIKNYWNFHLGKKLIKKGIDPKTHKPLATTTTPSDQDYSQEQQKETSKFCHSSSFSSISSSITVCESQVDLGSSGPNSPSRLNHQLDPLVTPGIIEKSQTTHEIPVPEFHRPVITSADLSWNKLHQMDVTLDHHDSISKPVQEQQHEVNFNPVLSSTVVQDIDHEEQCQRFEKQHGNADHQLEYQFALQELELHDHHSMIWMFQELDQQEEESWHEMSASAMDHQETGIATVATVPSMAKGSAEFWS